MEGDALPRLQPRAAVEILAPASGVGDHANSARRPTKLSQVRASLPKSAGAMTSSQRRRTGSSSGSSSVGGRSVPRAVGADPASDGCESAAVVFTQRQITTHTQPTVVRPSSTRTGTPRKATTREPPTDPQSDQLQQSQWHAILHENEQLRLEMSRLQQQLVEKLRGNAKILVGGGQFRASANSYSLPNKSQPGSSSTQACGSCVSLRASFKKAREGFDEARDVLKYRIVELERGEMQAQMNLNEQNEEMAALRDEIQRLRQAEGVTTQQLQSKQKMIESLDRELVALQATIIENSQRGSAISDLKHSGEHLPADSADCATQCDDLRSKDDEPRWVEATRTAEQAESRVRALQGMYNELEETCAVLQGELAAAGNENQQLVSRHDQRDLERESRLRELERDCEVLSIRCRKYEDDARSSAGVISKLEQELAALRHQIEAITKKSGDQMEEKMHRIDELEARELEYAALTSSLRCRLNDVEECQRNSVDGGTIMEAQIEQLKRDIHALEETLQVKSSALKEQEQQTEEIGLSLIEVKLQLEAAKEALGSARQEVDDAAFRLAAAEEESVAQANMLRRVRKSHAAALEKAMQSMVRLCVVAPTVHVHLNTGSGANSTSGSTSVNCKAALPQAQLRRVVEQEVLPLFATVFVQSQEGTSPQGTLMDPWLQSLLREMQESLAAHLQKLYATTSASQSATLPPPSISG